MARFISERQAVADMCRTLSDQGYFAGTGGNIGVRLDDRLMAVTPSATDYYIIGAEDIVVLDIDTLAVVEGDKAPTVEKSLHASMLKMFPERRASIHTHQPVASAVALSHQILPWPEGADRSALGAHVAVVPYRPSGTGMLAKAFRKALKPGVFAYLMASHGAICSATDLSAALAMIRKIDAAAAIFMRQRVAARANIDPQLQAFVLKTLEKATLKGA
jgi:L-fuculose-phosphate aldolase